jgi:frataxin-like iron-binding protein CyaY
MHKLSTKSVFSVNLEMLAGVMTESSHFKRDADEALTTLLRRLSATGDDFGFEASLESGGLTIEFDEQPAQIVVTPHAATEQIWLTSGPKKCKLNWDVVENAFILEATGQTLQEVLEETISRLVGDDVSL